MAAIRGPLTGQARPRPLGKLRVGNPFGPINWWVWGGMAIVGLSALLPVLQSATVTSEGFSMQRSQEQESILNGQISILESDIGQMTSLSRIQQRAQQLGLQPSTDPTFVHVDVAGPAPAKIPAADLPAPVTTQEPPESWWQSLLHWLPVPN